MHIVLVSMPWASIDMPPLGLGILARLARKTHPDVKVTVVSGNLEYVDWMAEREPLASEDYKFFATESQFQACGDWVFTPALYDSEPHEAEFERYLSAEFPQERLDLMRRLRALSPDFVRDFASSILDLAPDVVGFTSTFQQHAASLAMARQLKRVAPDVATVFGGANCDGPQGAALHRNFDCVDHVVRGEGETTFPPLIDALLGERSLADVPGLCWRAADGSSMINEMELKPVPPGDLVTPDLDQFYDRWARSAARNWLEPVLVVEGARGCWWGAKHHCTFCGLNGSFMEFRSKSPGRFYDEIMELVERHKVLDVYIVDNILDMSYITSLLPRFSENEIDLKIHCEVKSNLREQHLIPLAEAGVVSIQPGIENLNSRVLKLMDKGATGGQNIRILRDADPLGIKVAWNYLYGFPGETADDYTDCIAQFPALHHLPPPETIDRIVIERFSPYFERPELGFPDLRPSLPQRLIYDLPEKDLYDFTYVFDAASAGIDDELGAELKAAAASWQRAAVHSRLTFHDTDEGIVLISARQHFDWETLVLDDPLEIALFRLLTDPRTVATLRRKLSAELSADVTEAQLRRTLSGWRELGIVFNDGDQFIHVATKATNQELLRIRGDFHRQAVPSAVGGPA